MRPRGGALCASCAIGAWQRVVTLPLIAPAGKISCRAVPPVSSRVHNGNEPVYMRGREVNRNPPQPC